MGIFRKKLILLFAIFFVVFVPYAIVYKNYWFVCDDLGTILNGLIKSWKDFFRVFSEDMRNYHTPYNFNYSVPNVISGYYRPIQQIFFSIIHFFFGTPYTPYILTAALLHAMNSSLFFLVLANFLPLFYSVSGALLFAFYPNMHWITIICGSFQGFLQAFFFLLALLFYIPLFNKKSLFHLSISYYLSGFFFLLSLLSRENFIILVPWIFWGTHLVEHKQKAFWEKIHLSLSRTWIFFVSAMVYMLLRLNAFGIETIPRTINSATIRFPLFKKILPQCMYPAQAISPEPSLTKSIFPIVQKSVQKTEAVLSQVGALANLQKKMFAFLKAIFNISPQTKFIQIFLVLLALFIMIFAIIGFRKRKMMFLFLVCGIPLFAWPSFIISPSPRYIHPVQLLLIFIVLIAIFYFVTQSNKTVFVPIVKTLFLILFGLLMINGLYKNILTKTKAKFNCQESHLRKFVKRNMLPHKSHIIFLTATWETDITERLQIITNNFNFKVANVSFLGVKRNSKYTVKQIPGGFRFTAADKDSSGWIFWRRPPHRWNEQERAYNMAKEHFKKNRWYKFSMGDFLIHNMTHDNLVKDVSFVFNKKFLIKNTFFVIKDTIKNRYQLLDSSHLF